MMITIIVPVYREQDNVLALVAEIAVYLRGTVPTRVLFVDDSPDLQTVEAIQAAAAQYGVESFTVDFIHREGETLKGGLSGAVTDGFMLSGTEFVAVMDGDGQHPPAVIARMHQTMSRGGADLVVGSRYCHGGSSAGLDGSLRVWASRVSTWAAKALFPYRLRGVSDPMSGCFMVRRDQIDLGRLRPEGFKILLEILVTHPSLRRDEVPLRFRAREAGESKGTLKLALTYMRQLTKLRFSSTHRREVLT